MDYIDYSTKLEAGLVSIEATKDSVTFTEKKFSEDTGVETISMVWLLPQSKLGEG